MIGEFCVIEQDVQIGRNVSIGHHVILKAGTRIGDDVTIADGCMTTGLCIISDNVAIRTGTVISKGVIIEDWAFIGAGVMTSHTRNVTHGRPWLEHKQYVTRIGRGAVIGSRVNMAAGVRVAMGTVVGYGSNILHDCDKPDSVYFNREHPWATFQKHIPVGNHAYFIPPDQRNGDWRVNREAAHYEHPQFDPEDVERYMPALVIA